MEIELRLDRNFTTQFNRLKEKYGQKMTELNGFDDKQLSYTDFIDNFVDKKVVQGNSIECIVSKTGNSRIRLQRR